MVLASAIHLVEGYCRLPVKDYKAKHPETVPISLFAELQCYAPSTEMKGRKQIFSRKHFRTEFLMEWVNDDLGNENLGIATRRILLREALPASTILSAILINASTLVTPATTKIPWYNKTLRNSCEGNLFFVRADGEGRAPGTARDFQKRDDSTSPTRTLSRLADNRRTKVPSHFDPVHPLSAKLFSLFIVNFLMATYDVCWDIDEVARPIPAYSSLAGWDETACQASSSGQGTFFHSESRWDPECSLFQQNAQDNQSASSCHDAQPRLSSWSSLPNWDGHMSSLECECGSTIARVEQNACGGSATPTIVPQLVDRVDGGNARGEVFERDASAAHVTATTSAPFTSSGECFDVDNYQCQYLSTDPAHFLTNLNPPALFDYQTDNVDPLFDVQFWTDGAVPVAPEWYHYATAEHPGQYYSDDHNGDHHLTGDFPVLNPLWSTPSLTTDTASGSVTPHSLPDAPSTSKAARSRTKHRRKATAPTIPLSPPAFGQSSAYASLDLREPEALTWVSYEPHPPPAAPAGNASSVASTSKAVGTKRRREATDAPAAKRRKREKTAKEKEDGHIPVHCQLTCEDGTSCGFDFAGLDNDRAHAHFKEVHKADNFVRPFVCPWPRCDADDNRNVKPFEAKCPLVRHLVEYHAQAPEPCPYCGKLIRKSSHSKHIRRLHSRSHGKPMRQK
ncbi:hypothetical protein FISHEDRAFT_54950 [Fistulina hepatica ATCC 64428]|uniref:Uncharacterized protein n=1 Tax=Fistulina hepatica ATCC 64428 TaxID=1128425 RepID=A0A0D7APY2_9AGAR|nr:hypothetical protein FISHEDRAFT_54950 [Fistulina hepatica ATCC 64428]